jgi:hypothetical protein
MKVNYLYLKIAYSLYLSHYREAMKLLIFFTHFSLLTGVTEWSEPLFQTLDKSNFYSVMASARLREINEELTLIASSSIKEKEAYEGALLMRKAGLLIPPHEKLSSFKTGYHKLEAALAKDSSNGEYHFLRLIIQEHVPKFVHYDKDRVTDSQDVYRAYRNLPPAVQTAILDYSRHSKLLHAKELNE